MWTLFIFSNILLFIRKQEEYLPGTTLSVISSILNAYLNILCQILLNIYFSTGCRVVWSLVTKPVPSLEKPGGDETASPD